MADAVHSLGYRGAQFSYDIDPEVEPANVTVTVEPGPLYHVALVNVLRPDGQPLLIPRGGKEDATQTRGTPRGRPRGRRGGSAAGRF